VRIAAATLSGNSLRQTVHTNRASVHQAVKLVAALLRVARVTAGLAESNGILYRRVYDSRHLQLVGVEFNAPLTCRLTAQKQDQLRTPTLVNRVCATFTFL